ncbi:MAG: hypothetical protein US76_04490 [Parcubacteria group bacterium GW2011_GWA2_38_13b]|nr:MAG: hypothetical protein US76_04490 [Parcubacteria group bacterium GW2011_GWA2_38_13b]
MVAFKLLENLKILIVEDDQFLRDLFVMKLKKEKAIVLESDNGEDALQKVKSEMPDLVLLDIVLPKMDGFCVLKKIKDNEKTNKIIVILLTNLGQDFDVERGLELGAAAYIVKAHFTPSGIIEKIQEIL